MFCVNRGTDTRETQNKTESQSLLYFVILVGLELDNPVTVAEYPGIWYHLLSASIFRGDREEC